MLKANKTILYEKLKESLSSVLPITAIVFVLCFTVVPVPTDILISFIIGAIMLILGMGLFTLGTDLAMTPIGSEVGSAITRSRKLWFIALISLVVGIIITIAEPDLQVLAEQVPNIPNMTIIITVAVGVGVFLVIAMLRIVFKIPLNYLLIGFYAAVFVVSIFVSKEFLAVAFDSGGVTTGPMTVPFIMALGVGAAAIRTDKNAEQDSFGLVALCSIGPIISVLVLGLIFKPTGADAAYSSNVLPVFEDTKALWNYFKDAIPHYLKEVVLALSPIIVFFVIFQLTSIKMKKDRLIRITIGLVYTFIGLVIFLTGVNVGFMPMGSLIGKELGMLEYNWIVVPIGMLMGYFIVAAEPAVHVLNKQVYELTNGMIPKKALSVSLSIGVCASVGLAMIRILTGHGGNRGSRQVPSFMDRQAHFDNADHHEGHDTEHSIRHCEADLHERRSGAQYPEFQHIHDRRRHRKRADRLYFGAVRERPACGGNGGEGGKAGYSGSDKCPHGQAYLFRLRRARSYGGQYRRERALYLFAGVRQHRGTGIHEQR